MRPARSAPARRPPGGATREPVRVAAGPKHVVTKGATSVRAHPRPRRSSSGLLRRPAVLPMCKRRTAAGLPATTYCPPLWGAGHHGASIERGPHSTILNGPPATRRRRRRRATTGARTRSHEIDCTTLPVSTFRRNPSPACAGQPATHRSCGQGDRRRRGGAANGPRSACRPPAPAPLGWRRVDQVLRPPAGPTLFSDRAAGARGSTEDARRRPHACRPLAGGHQASYTYS